MSDHKIKNREALLSHGDAGAKAQVLELTERVLQRLDARKRLHEMMHREGSELVIGSRRHDLSRYRHVYAFSSGTGLRGPAGGVSDAGRHHHQDSG